MFMVGPFASFELCEKCGIETYHAIEIIDYDYCTHTVRYFIYCTMCNEEFTEENKILGIMYTCSTKEWLDIIPEDAMTSSNILYS